MSRSEKSAAVTAAAPDGEAIGGAGHVFRADPAAANAVAAAEHPAAILRGRVVARAAENSAAATAPERRASVRHREGTTSAPPARIIAVPTAHPIPGGCGISRSHVTTAVPVSAPHPDAARRRGHHASGAEPKPAAVAAAHTKAVFLRCGGMPGAEAETVVKATPDCPRAILHRRPAGRAERCVRRDGAFGARNNGGEGGERKQAKSVHTSSSWKGVARVGARSLSRVVLERSTASVAEHIEDDTPAPAERHIKFTATPAGRTTC